EVDNKLVTEQAKLIKLLALQTKDLQTFKQINFFFIERTRVAFYITRKQQEKQVKTWFPKR
ncbi:MAG: hypothetical protein O7D30_06320, partial [Rickettsia endosymbiont of Ixodes persulcatus]|nr:hypothetical protein [Rickettsia endosymbiont of Ixodes persulcatus]